METIEPVELPGNLVTLVPLQVEHASGLVAAASAEVFAWLSYPVPTNLEEARAWVDSALTDRRSGRRFPFTILRTTDRSVVGSTSYWDFDPHNRHVEIGSTWTDRASWGTGTNTEAKLLLLTHGFESLELERVAFRTDVCNRRSQRAIEKLGAVTEGAHRHEMLRRDGSWRDSIHYSILRAEWPASKARLIARLDDVSGQASV